MSVVYGRNSLNRRFDELCEVVIFRNAWDCSLRVLKFADLLWDIGCKVVRNFWPCRIHHPFLLSRSASHAQLRPHPITNEEKDSDPNSLEPGSISRPR